jgi:hypothetical protein
MKKVLSAGCLFSVIPAFAGTPSVSAGIPPVWVQPLMLFAMLLLAIASRQISRVR